VGPAAGCLPLMARHTWADPPGAAATLAGAKRRPPRARGVGGRAPGHGSQPLAGRPLQPGGPPRSGGGCRRPSPGSRGGRRASPTGCSPLVGLCRRRPGGHRRADAGRGPGRRGRQPRPGRAPVLPEQGEAVSSPTTRSRRGRPPQAAAPQGEVRSRLGVPPEALAPSAEAPGWPVLATTVRPAVCTATALLQASQERQSTVAPGWRGSQASRGSQPGVAGATRTDGGVSQAHGRGVAGGYGEATAGPALSPRA
jgi:hypothetical protein